VTEPVKLPSLDDFLRAGFTEMDYQDATAGWEDLDEDDQRRVACYIAALVGMSKPH
jgi:hypothetical protein